MGTRLAWCHSSAAQHFTIGPLASCIVFALDYADALSARVRHTVEAISLLLVTDDLLTQFGFTFRLSSSCHRVMLCPDSALAKLSIHLGSLAVARRRR